jgi:dynactin 1
MALLRFKRISFKANLIHEFVKERIASFGAKGTDDDVFAACDVVDKLTWITTMAERFVNSICSCSVEDFSNYDSALYELEPVERALNGYIDGLRRDEIKERDMAQELQRSIAVMSHLASIHVKDDLASYADHLLMRTQCLQSQLESAATALQLSKSLVESNVPKDEEEDDDEGSASDLAIILTRAETLVNHVRSAKVMASKTHRALTDLQQRSLTLESSCTEVFDRTEAVVTEVVSYTIQAGNALQTLFSEEGRNDPFTPSEVASALSRTAMSLFSLQAPEAGPFTALATRLRDLADALTDLASLPTDLDNTVEFERAAAPWVARANELKRTKTISIDTEAELAKTLETLRGKDTVIKEKETELEEQSVRIEMLEARMKDASKRSAKIAELERNLHEAKDAERKAKREVERAKEERDRDVERAREEVGRLGEERKKGAGADLDADAMGAGAKITMKRQEHKIRSLEGAVRYLKEENHKLRLPSPDSPLSAQSTLDWLHQPLSKQRSDVRKRHETALKEGKDLLQQLLSVASMPQTIDLSKMPENKLAWRPAKESSRWKVEKRKEEWEMWKDWRKEVVLKGSGRAEIV